MQMEALRDESGATQRSIGTTALLDFMYGRFGSASDPLRST
jgi:hypothetical protein